MKLIKKTYVDNCVLNRPFDDQSQARIFIETKAFYIILELISLGKVKSIDSDILQYENEMLIDTDRKLKIRNYLSTASFYISISDVIIKRAEEIIELNFRPIDALHIATEEGRRKIFGKKKLHEIINEINQMKDSKYKK